VSVRLLKVLASGGHQVWARKPAQSFAPDDDPGSTDAALLAAATGEHPFEVCPEHRWYPVAMAPPMAAHALGQAPLLLSELLTEIVWTVDDRGPLTPSDGQRSVGLVETAGGVGSPQADDGDGLDLLGLLRPDSVVIVAGAGLGIIHDVRLCLWAFATRSVDAPGIAAGRLSLTPLEGPNSQVHDDLVVVLNQFDPADELHVANRKWLEQHEGVLVLVTPGDERLLADWVLERR
jgi:dethiobiotin synthetase